MLAAGMLLELERLPACPMLASHTYRLACLALNYSSCLKLGHTTNRVVFRICGVLWHLCFVVVFVSAAKLAGKQCGSARSARRDSAFGCGSAFSGYCAAGSCGSNNSCNGS